MNQIIGGVVGALVTGIAILGWSGRAAQDDVAYRQAIAEPRAQLVSDSWNAAGPQAVAEAEPLVDVSCEPGQRAVLRRNATVAGAAVQAGCVDDAAAWPTTRANSLVVPAASAYAAPAVYRAPRAVPARTVYREPVARRVDSKRSWKKTALVIGGSAGAGAGIGALAGGKKGALIGAAVGGGAGTVYELLKRERGR